MNNGIALIFANGVLEKPELVSDLTRGNPYLIAADGGYHHLKTLGMIPHLLIGDLDSVTGEEVDFVMRQGCEVLRFPPEKDETDLELALIEAPKRGFETLIVVAGLGGRLDQTLSNIYLLNLPQLSGCDVRLDDGLQEVFLLKTFAEIHGNPGDIVSLLPVSPIVQGITTNGLRYPLVNEDLIFFRSRGISNEMTGSKADVQIQSGILLCIHLRERLLI